MRRGWTDFQMHGLAEGSCRRREGPRLGGRFAWNRLRESRDRWSSVTRPGQQRYPSSVLEHAEGRCGLPAAKSWSVVWIIGANRGDSQLRRRETLVMADGQKASVGFGAPGVSAGGEGDQFAEADFGAGFRALG